MGIYTAAIQKLYVAYFNRPADVGGLQFWEGVVTAAKGDTSAVAKAFAGSDEYKSTYANMDAYHVVNAVYQNLFGRPAEVDGLNFWAQNLMKGAFTVDAAVTAIAAGAQGTDLAVYNNKVTAATAFTGALDTNAEILGYSGTAANLLAKQWMSTITSDADALKAAIATDALNQAVSTVTNPPVVGQTYNLSIGLDTIPGTAGNDTINAYSIDTTSGAPKTTLNAADTIDGGAGNDVLNIQVTDTENTAFVGTVKNVETINIDYSAKTAAAGAVDASKFQGATLVNQISTAGDVSNLAVGTTAGYQAVSTGALKIDAAGATAVASFKDVGEAATLAFTGTALSGVTVSGNRVDTDSSGSVAKLGLTVTAGKDVQTVSVNTAFATNLTVNDGTGKKVTTVDASASAGAIVYSAASTVTTIKSGAGADDLTLNALTAAATDTTAAVNASVTSGAGNDKVTVVATGDGQISVDTGAGNDTVIITNRDTAKLVVNMGDGADVFKSSVAINAGDMIDAGAGVDTLTLSLVGAANIGAFSNFDVFDTVGLAKNLDVDILASKNTVSEIVASGDVGAAAALANIGSAGFRATGDMGATNYLSLTQKTAGALTVTVDADEANFKTKGDVAADTTTANVIATNATSLKAVFDTAFIGSVTGEATTGDNVATLNLKGGAATTLDITSGGANAHDVLNYTDTGTGGKLTTITVAGASDLTLAVTTAAKLATIDASASTGGLTVSTDALGVDGGSIKLGSGVDTITVGTKSIASGAEAIVGFEKTAAIAVSTASGDATAAAAAQADADTLVFATGAVAANGAVTGGAVKNGVLTFSGAGPSDLASAVAIADGVAVGSVVAFEYLGNTYVVQHGTTDLVVKLTGVTGVTNVGETGTDHFFLV